MELRPYQASSIAQLRDAFRQGYNKIGLMLPTGAGKTVIAANIIQSALSKNKRVAFIADRIDLIEQTSASFEHYGIEHGIIQADHWKTNYNKPVQICSIQTLARRRWPGFDIAIVDEFHSLYKAQIDMLNKWDNLTYIGLSATPFTKGLGQHWQHLIVGATTKQLIRDGYLSDFVVYAPPVVDLKGVRTQAGDYNQKQLAERVDQDKPVGDVIKTWQKYGDNRQTMVFAVNIAHSRHIVSEFVRAGISALHIDAYTDPDERRSSLRAYKEGRVQVISCVDILTKGFDEPNTGTLVMARPTKSLIVHLQQIGRALRIAPDKENAIILDHGGNVERHGFPTDEVITVLNTDVQKTQPKTSEKTERLPKACPICHFVKPAGVVECPSCGFKPERINTVEHEAGELVKLEKVSKEDKQRWFSMLLGHCKQKRYSAGWAKHKYKEKFGVWPRGLSTAELEPAGDVARYIKYLNIRYAKSNARR